MDFLKWLTFNVDDDENLSKYSRWKSFSLHSVLIVRYRQRAVQSQQTPLGHGYDLCSWRLKTRLKHGKKHEVRFGRNTKNITPIISCTAHGTCVKTRCLNVLYVADLHSLLHLPGVRCVVLIIRFFRLFRSTRTAAKIWIKRRIPCELRLFRLFSPLDGVSTLRVT